MEFRVWVLWFLVASSDRGMAAEVAGPGVVVVHGWNGEAAGSPPVLADVVMDGSRWAEMGRRARSD